MMMERWGLKAAHAHGTSNEKGLARSAICACFHCLETYPPSAVIEWIEDSDGRTAICPRCGIDSVLGDASGFPVTDAAFLSAMNERWFGAAVSTDALQNPEN